MLKFKSSKQELIEDQQRVIDEQLKLIQEQNSLLNHHLETLQIYNKVIAVICRNINIKEMRVPLYEFKDIPEAKVKISYDQFNYEYLVQINT